MSGNNVVETSAGWAAGFCERYANTALDLAKWFLILALVLGVLMAVVALIAAYKGVGSGSRPEGQEVAGLPTFVNAIKALLEAFKSAPVWLALFFGGVLLLWMAASLQPAICDPDGGGNEQSEENEQAGGNEQTEGNEQAGGNGQTGADADNAADPAGNGSGNEADD